MRTYTNEILPQLSEQAQSLSQRILTKQAVIGIVGLGYVGLPIALEFAKQGFHTIGVDTSAERVQQLAEGGNYIEDLLDEEVSEMVESGKIRVSVSYEMLQEADIIYICVPTPFNANKEPNLSYIVHAGKEVAKYMSPSTLIILKSTTFPGTTEDHLQPLLDESGLLCGEDYFLAFSPERVDPGNQHFNMVNTPIITGGVDKDSSILAGLANYQITKEVYLVNSPKVAELEKLLENIFRCVNIALVNELALLCERIGGIDVWEVIEAAGTKPFGFMKFTPGPGVGGHCIPIDPYYLSWLARKYDFETKFITLSANVNEGMPYHIANLVIETIARQPITLDTARILILGASFKRNIRDTRNSPSGAMILRLKSHGIQHIDISDPLVPIFKVNGIDYPSVDLTPENLATYHCAVLVTDHDQFDVDFVLKHVPFLVDTRNFTKNAKENREKIVLLGSREE